MNETEIKQMLDQLAEFQAECDVIELQKQSLVNEILTDEVKAMLAEVDARFADKMNATSVNITNLQDKIKQAIIELGISVKGTFLHAVWSKGRVSWNSKALDGYAVAHPEIVAFRKEGEPSASIRVVK